MGCSGLGSGAQANLLLNPHPPKVMAIYPVRSDILALEINVGEVIQGKQQPYNSQLGDKIKNPRPQDDDWVKNPIGAASGALVGPARNVIYPFDRLEGGTIDWESLTQPKAITLQPTNAGPALEITAIHRKTKPRDVARTGTWKMSWATTSTLYLDLKTPLIAGQSYQIQFADPRLAPAIYRHLPDTARTEAVQVSHIGFRSQDPGKVAFLSTWMGDGGGLDYLTSDYPSLQFALHDRQNQVVYQGPVQLSRAKNQPEDGRKRNYNGTNVYSMDFSSFQQAGEYRVCVTTIGCSFPFKIADDVWDWPFYTSVRGLYHQRSGIAIGPPYSTYQRPIGFDAKTPVYQATARLVDNDQGIYGLTGFMKLLPQTRTQELVPNASGGYFDAGDWDRRVQHVEVSRSLIELAELFPAYIDRVKLQIPESATPLPDVIDEALWNLDFYRRLQTPDGGIRGGIQSAQYPKYGEASWQETLPVLAYAPDPWASYCYVAGAAQIAHWLETSGNQNSALAKTYRDSATRAMDYAEREYANPKELSRQHFEVRDARNLAALAMLRLTQAPRWSQIFQATTVFTDPAKPTHSWNSHNQRDAAFLYLRLPENLTNQNLRQNIRSAFLHDADRAVSNTQQSGYKWAKDDDSAPIGWGSSWGAPKTVTLLRAHALTQDPKYLQAAMLATQFSIGANPLNLTYTTGLGHRSPQHPLIADQRVSGQAPPPGITVYGPLDPIENPKEWYVEMMQDQIYPAYASWPATEMFLDVYVATAMDEFTVMQTIAPTAYTWGYFAARALQ
jgi:endoglucanase